MLLEVGEGHSLYIATNGSLGGSSAPSGKSPLKGSPKNSHKSSHKGSHKPAVVFLHGGPGGASSPSHFRFFPKTSYGVRFDQRGCGRSKWTNSPLHHNTTRHLVADMEKIRTRLGITKWLVFGGSWGSTLALCYALAHPERVTGLVLRGLFLGTKAEMDWAFEKAAGVFMPELAQKVAQRAKAMGIPDTKALAKRVLAGDGNAARLWGAYEWGLCSLNPPPFRLPARVPNSPLLECHYAANGFFISQPILKRINKIKHLRAVIVQGRYDLLCPPKNAFALAEAWGKNCQLEFINNAGHSASEPATEVALKKAVRRLLS